MDENRRQTPELIQSEMEALRVSMKAHEETVETLQGLLFDSPPLIVKMPDGKIIARSEGIDTFVEVIERLGIERVKSLGIVVGRDSPLILDHRDPELVYRQRRSGSYYIVSGTNTETKKELLDEIADGLGYEMQVIANPGTRS